MTLSYLWEGISFCLWVLITWSVRFYMSFTVNGKVPKNSDIIIIIIIISLSAYPNLLPGHYLRTRVKPTIKYRGFHNCWNKTVAYWGDLKEHEDLDEEEQWFRQDGAPSHTANVIMAWLYERFVECLISCIAELEWAPHLTDLNPQISSSGGSTRATPHAIASLKWAITEKIQAIIQEECACVINNFALNSAFQWMADIWSMYSRDALDIFGSSLRLNGCRF